MYNLRYVLRYPQICKRLSKNTNSQNVRTFSSTNIARLRFVQFAYLCDPRRLRVGCMSCGGVVDLCKFDCAIPPTMVDILKQRSMARVYGLLRCNPRPEPLNTVHLLAPITGMDKIICVGLNYCDHCRELRKEVPSVPMMFSKFASCVIGPSERVKMRIGVSRNIDWEVELAVVIGAQCTGVKTYDAYKYVFGYTIGQDLTSRDWQMYNGGQFLLGKCQDNFCPMGPWIVTKDEVCNVDFLKLRCSVNGMVKQDGNTSDMIYKIPMIIERLGKIMTLLPGDVILTGTPAGVGANRKPKPQFLKPGDILRSEIECIGCFDTLFVC